MEQVPVSPQSLALLGSILLANIGVIFGAYVSIRVQIAKIQVAIEFMKKDIDGLGAAMRASKE